MNDNGQHPVRTIDDVILSIKHRNATLEAEGKRLAQQAADQVYAPYSAAINENLQRIAELTQLLEDNHEHSPQQNNPITLNE